MSKETKPVESPKRWSASRKKDVVMRLLRGEKVDEVSREVGVAMSTLEEWKSSVVDGMDVLLKAHKDHPLQEELDRAKKKIGELSMENELLWKRARKANPFPMGRSKK